MNWLLFVLILVLSYVSEIWTVKYYLAATNKRAVKATVFSVLLVLASALSIILYVENPMYLIPELIGTAAGTYHAVAYGKDISDRK